MVIHRLTNTRYGVMGKGISYSLSPTIHQFWMNLYGLSERYDVVDIQAQEMKPTLNQWITDGLRGANVTIPFKKEAFSLMDEVDALALKAKAVNTIKVMSDGKLLGYNTDARALIDLVSFPVKKAIILGTGGAASASFVALKELKCSDITFVARRPNDIDKKIVKSWPLNLKDLEECDCLVNATPVELNVDLSFLPSEACVIDWNYRTSKTTFLSSVEGKNLKIIKGLQLLVQQARYGFFHWFDVFPEITDEFWAHLKKAQGEN